MLLCREKMPWGKACPATPGEPGGAGPSATPPWPLCIIPWNGIHSARASV